MPSDNAFRHIILSARTSSEGTVDPLYADSERRGQGHRKLRLYSSKHYEKYFPKMLNP